MNTLLEIDKAVFLFINRSLANPASDFLMPLITEEDHYRIPILIIWAALVIFGGRKGAMTAVLSVLILAIDDQIVNFLIKPLVGRTRPCFVVEGMRLLIDQPNSPSFPSSHAANMAAMAVLFSSRYPRWKAVFISLAALIAWSRIAVGAHYPSDVLAGAAVGTAVAWTVLLLSSRIVRLWKLRKTPHSGGKP
ncbi:phosphatase PAP2 family protein [bacterium]|nr:phosphatase PAP2 family protein [bacterium]